MKIFFYLFFIVFLGIALYMGVNKTFNQEDTNDEGVIVHMAAGIE